MRTTIMLCILSACATTGPSPELVTARHAYALATAPGTPVAQAPLIRAQEELNAAEEEHYQDPQSLEERHLAYIATRDAQIAMERGKAQVALEQSLAANKKYTAMLEGKVQSQQVVIEDLTKRQKASRPNVSEKRVREPGKKGT